MGEARSMVTTDIDLERDDKEVSYLRVPWPSHHSAYGWVPVPIAGICNGNGPTVRLQAGNHGNEYEGQVVLAHLVCTPQPSEVSGRLVVAPAINAPAARAGTRAFQPAVQLADEVEAGAVAGLIHFTDQPLRDPFVKRFKVSGFVFCMRAPAPCERGDMLVRVATDYQGPL